MSDKDTQLVTAADLMRWLGLGGSDVRLVLTAAGGQSGGRSLHPAVKELITSKHITPILKLHLKRTSDWIRA